MSIRLIAIELYRLHRQVEELEKARDKAPALGKGAIEDKLRKTRAEYQRIKQALEGHKQVQT